ncbi:MAG TPA: hypothetical protein VJ770_10360 [Stellaceae bacterium]|nr:hypothetical protein [Stellaceae bacterium]
MPRSIEGTCCVCGEQLQFVKSPHPGRSVSQWGDLIICRECERDNHDGIVIASHPDLPERIKKAGGAFVLSMEGHIVIPPIDSN